MKFRGGSIPPACFLFSYTQEIEMTDDSLGMRLWLEHNPDKTGEGAMIELNRRLGVYHAQGELFWDEKGEVIESDRVVGIESQ